MTTKDEYEFYRLLKGAYDLAVKNDYGFVVLIQANAKGYGKAHATEKHHKALQQVAFILRNLKGFRDLQSHTE